MKIRICIFLFIISSIVIQAQQMLTPDDALNIALKNNYDILLAMNDADIAKRNNTAGNAGMLPNLSLNAAESYSLNNVDQKLSSGIETNSPEATTKNLNAGVELNWTLFDGCKMFVTKNKLNEIQVLGEIQYKDKVLQTEYDVIVAYYDIVRQKQQLASIDEVISSNQERVNILTTSFKAGLSPKTNLLQAQIDLNVYREAAINQQAAILASKRNLNQLLSREVNTLFEVADSIPLNYTPDKNELSQKLYSSNTGVLSLQKQIDVASLSLKEFKTTLLPKIYFDAGYNFLQTDNNTGTILMNRAYGPQLGGTISIPLYQSGNALRQIDAAKIQLQSTEYSLERIKLQVNTELQNALTEYESQQQMLEIERVNSEMAKENLDISMQRLRLGQTTSLELHQALESYVGSYTRLINFEYNLKVAETKLKQLLSSL
jgi:outer membrane protein